MAISLKHAFTSLKSDGGDATLVRPTNWNAEHTLTATDNRLLGTNGSTTVTEITCTAAGRALLDDAAASDQRTTLGLGTSAVKDTGTSGNNVPLLDGANTWSASQSITGSLTVSNGFTVSAGAVSLPATSVAGASLNSDTWATGAETLAATSTVKGITPANAHHHPSAVQALCKFAASGAIARQTNVTSVTKNSVGDWTVAFTTAFADANYIIQLTVLDATNSHARVLTQSAGGFTIKAVVAADNSDTDPDAIYFTCQGPLA
jgi:hypothetical protein